MRTRLAAALAAVLMTIGLMPVMATAEAEPEFRALLFTKTAGYRHDSIPAGVAMFKPRFWRAGTLQPSCSASATIMPSGPRM